MIETDLRSFLLGVPALVALTGDDSNAGKPARICPVKLPQGSMIGLVYTTISKTRDRGFDGRSGYCDARIQLDFVDLESDGVASYSEAKAAMDAVRNVLDGYSGPMGGSIVQLAEVDGDRDSWEETVRAYVIGFDVILRFDEG